MLFRLLQLIEENAYEALANIKRANKYAKVHDRTRSFVLSAYSMHELRNQNISVG